MRGLLRAAGIMAIVSGCACYAAPAHAIIVERVVAIIGDKPILQSELRERSLPFLEQIEEKVPLGPQRDAAISQLYKDLALKMVDEELIAQAAERSHVAVTSEDLDNAIANIAAQQGMTIDQLFKAARKAAGFRAQYYRDEIRRQVLEGKMLQLRVKGRVRITEEDVRQKYEAILREERAMLDYHPAWILIHVMPGTSPQATAQRRDLAEQIAERAKKGEDFAALSKAYSDDTPRRDTGGDLGWKSTNAPLNAPPGQPPPPKKYQAIAREFETPLLSLDPGQVTGPIHVGDDFFILKLVARAPSTVPLYEKAKPLVMQLKQTDILNAEKKKWLEELKGRTHVVVRNLTSSSCTSCGTCCFSELREYIRVFGIDWDRFDDRAKTYAEFDGNRCFMRIEGGRCSALLIDPIARTFHCSIYEMRPDVCRSLEAGSGACQGEIVTKAERPLIAIERLLRKPS